jgi:long-chain acyl-CoA synthetase
MKNPKTYVPQPRALKSGPFNVPAPGFEKVEGETVPYRNAKSKDKLIDKPHEDISTLYDIVTYASAKFGNARCMGSRKLVKMHNETKKIKKVIDGREQEVEKNWSYFELSGYSYITFTEYEQKIHKVGAGLKKLGLQPQEKIEIFASTSANWLATAHGAMSQSVAIVTAYDTLGEEGLKHSLTQTKAKAIFLDAALFPKFVNPLKAAKDLKHVIYNVEGDFKQDLLEKMKSEHPDVTFNTFDEVVKLGEENPADPNPPSPEDVACVMYTSGSTGAPKGVMLKHKNVIASGKSIIQYPELRETDTR